MNIQQFLDEMINLQSTLLCYIEHEDNTEESFQNLEKIFEDQKISEDHHYLKLVLHLITKISNNHDRGPNFFDKIERIIHLLSNEIKKKFSNSEIFNIFKSNKRLLLYLINAKMLTIDESIITVLTSKKYKKKFYHEYFSIEIDEFLNKKQEKQEESLEKFKEKRKIGENDEEICEIIRKDEIEKFISIVKKENLSLQSDIKHSIFETNSFLLNKTSTLIEYAAFFGSIQIFNYLRLNNVDLSPSLWLYSIHSHKIELIHNLEANKVLVDYLECFNESIKCHHNDISNHFLEKNKINGQQNQREKVLNFFKFHNYQFIEESFINQAYFYYLCQYDHYTLIDILLNSKTIDINQNEIIIKNDLEKNSKKIIQKSPLLISIEKRNDEIVDLLLSNDKIDINHIYDNNEISERDQLVETNEQTLLHICIENEDIETIKLLLKSDKLDVNIPAITTIKNRAFTPSSFDQIKRTALVAAIENENVEIVRLLLTRKDLNINATSSKKLTFITFNPYTDEDDEEPALYAAVQRGNIEIIKLLLDHDEIDVNLSYHRTGDKQSYKTTGSNDVKFSYLFEESAFYNAVENEKYEIAKLLLMKKDKIDLNTRQNRIDLIFEGRTPINTIKVEKTALNLLIERGNVEMIKLLLESDALDVNLPNSKMDISGTPDNDYVKETEEKNPLSIAIENGNVEIIEILLKHDKIEINQIIDLYEKEKIEPKLTRVSKKCITALYFAIEKENIEIIKILLSNENIDINKECNELKLTAKTDERNRVTYLYDKTEQIRMNALIRAIEIENIEIIELLLANKNIKINQPKSSFIVLSPNENALSSETAFQLAVSKENIEIVKLLMTNDDLDVNVLSVNYIARSSEPIDNLSDGLDLFNDQPTKERDFEIKKFKTSKSALFNAIEKDNFDIIKLILNNKKTSINNIVYCYDETSIVGNEMYTKHVDRTPLTYGCDKRKIELINILLENDKVDINMTSSRRHDQYLDNELKSSSKIDENVIDILIEKDDIELIEFFLNNENLDINHRSNNTTTKFILNDEMSRITTHKKTLLFHAVEKNNIEIVKLFLMNPDINVNRYTIITEQDATESNIVTYQGKETALFLSIEKGNIDIIKLLVEDDRIDVNATSTIFEKEPNRMIIKRVQTPLYLAVEKESIEIIDVLFKNNKIDCAAFSTEKRRKETKSTTNIAYKYDKYSKMTRTALIRAVEIGNIEIINFFLSQFNILSFVNIKGVEESAPSLGESHIVKKTAFHIAIENENIEIIKLFMENEYVDINIPEDIETYNSDFLINMLNNRIKSSFKPDKKYFPKLKKDTKLGSHSIEYKNAFIIAVEKENIDIINILINSNIDINTRHTNIIDDEKFEETALHIAVDNENVEIVQILLDKKDIDIKFKAKLTNWEEDKTALSIAESLNNQPIIDLFLSKEKLKDI